jgi:hypothetical protein
LCFSFACGGAAAGSSDDAGDPMNAGTALI